jgi:large subunit ribosomal protein L19e
MTNLSVQRELAAKVLGVGKDRIVFDPDRIEDIEDAITREDIRRLYKEGAIKIKPVKGISRSRKRVKAEKRKARGRGPGRKKGPRVSSKRLWVNQVRAVRKLLRLLKQKGEIDNKTYRDLYMKVKGGAIRTRRRLLEIVEAIKRA